MERADAETVAGQQQPLAARIPQRDRELAAQARERRLGVLLIEVRNDLGIAVRAEGVPTGLEGRPLFRVVEQFAVVDDTDAAVFVMDRLLTISQADDAQAPRRQAQTWPLTK